jgi:hypothetical protein
MECRSLPIRPSGSSTVAQPATDPDRIGCSYVSSSDMAASGCSSAKACSFPTRTRFEPDSAARPASLVHPIPRRANSHLETPAADRVSHSVYICLPTVVRIVVDASPPTQSIECMRLKPVCHFPARAATVDTTGILLSTGCSGNDECHRDRAHNSGSCPTDYRPCL